MPNGQLDSVLQHIRKLVAAETTGTLPDRELLERFIHRGDEAAFAVLVRRYGPMVLGVCRRVLGQVHDAEDACQATFLVLARKAGSIRRKDSIGSWLHGVAYRAAANLKRDTARRHAHETRLVKLPEVEPADITWREVRVVLEEELQRLPKRFQAPLLLCYLEGKTRDEAARTLGWSLGTVRGRLERGRELLRLRLTRRGLTLSTALLASLLTKHAVTAAMPAMLVVRIVKAAMLLATDQAAAMRIISARITVLVEGVLKAMWMTKLKIAIAIWVAVSLTGVGVSVLARGALQAQPPAAPQDVAEETIRHDRALAVADKRELPIDSLQVARNQAESRVNLKKLALAMHNYQSAFNHLPAPAIYSKAVRGPVGLGGPMTTGFSGFSGGAPFTGGGLSLGGTSSTGGYSLGGGTGTGWSLLGHPYGDAVYQQNLFQGGSSLGGLGGGTFGTPTYSNASSMGMSTYHLVSKQGQALLSWRVAILPYLGPAEAKLYQQFKLDQPWDSPHNKALLAQMPRVYAPPGKVTHEPYSTFYQVFVGPHAAFEPHREISLGEFPDGPSQVLLIVEAGCAVPWTKPEDLHFVLDEPIPELGGLFPGMFNAAFANGSIWPLSRKIDTETLRKLIMRDDGQPVNPNRFRIPVSRYEAEWRQQNERLKQEVERVRSRVTELRREKETLQEIAEDPATEPLKKENARLEKLLRQSQDEAERLNQEIQRLKRVLEKRPDEIEKK